MDLFLGNFAEKLQFIRELLIDRRVSEFFSTSGHTHQKIRERLFFSDRDIQRGLRYFHVSVRKKNM